MPKESLINGLKFTTIPAEGTFSHLRDRISESRYTKIFHVLVDIFHQLEMIAFKILVHDGTLYLSEPGAYMGTV